MRRFASALMLGLAAVASAQAQPAATDTAGAGSLVEGEVRKVDRDAGKLTMRHGPIPNLEMPEMTMVFRVADPKMLEGLEPRKKVRFKAERVNGQITVTELQSED